MPFNFHCEGANLIVAVYLNFSAGVPQQHRLFCFLISVTYDKGLKTPSRNPESGKDDVL